MVKVQYYDFYTERLTECIGEIQFIKLNNKSEKIKDSDKIYSILNAADTLSNKVLDNLIISVQWDEAKTGIVGPHPYPWTSIRLVSNSPFKSIW